MKAFQSYRQQPYDVMEHDGIFTLARRPKDAAGSDGTSIMPATLSAVDPIGETDVNVQWTFAGDVTKLRTRPCNSKPQLGHLRKDFAWAKRVQQPEMIGAARGGHAAQRCNTPHPRSGGPGLHED